MFDFVKKIFGTAQGRLLKKYWKIVAEVNRLEERMQTLSDEELRHKTVEFRERIAQGETVDNCCRKPMPLSKMLAAACVELMYMSLVMIKNGI